jgi:hypothetical protein
LLEDNQTLFYYNILREATLELSVSQCMFKGVVTKQEGGRGGGGCIFFLSFATADFLEFPTFLRIRVALYTKITPHTGDSIIDHHLSFLAPIRCLFSVDGGGELRRLKRVEKAGKVGGKHTGSDLGPN